MRVVVTGGAGFIGSHVVDELLRRGHDVGVLDLQRPRNPEAGHVKGDLADLTSLERALDGADAVCHLAGVGDVYLAAKEPHTAALLNATGTTNVCEAALRRGVRKVVYASTWEVYGHPERQPIDESHPCRPDHPYNITKYAGELMTLAYDRLRDLPAAALRLGTAYGPRMRPNSVFSLFIGKALAGDPITIQGTGAQSRQFTHATDIARAFALAAESQVRGEAINVVARESVSIRQLAGLVRTALPTRIEYAEARAGDIAPAVVDSSKAERLLGWRAEVDFEAALREMIDEARAPSRVGVS